MEYTDEELDELYQRARHSMTGGGARRRPEYEDWPLSDAELDGLVQALDQASESYLQVKLLNILKYADVVQPHRSHAILKQILSRERPGHAAKVLMIVSMYWRETGDYSAELQWNIRAALPFEESCRRWAIQFAGEWLHYHSDVGMLRALVEVHEQPNPYEDEHVEEILYDSLNALKSATHCYDEPEAVVLAKAKALLAAYEGAV